MCQVLNDEHPCRCSDDTPAAFDPRVARAAGARLEAQFAPLLEAAAPQVVATIVPIPTTSQPARRPLMPFTSAPLLSSEHHWGVTTS